MVLPNGLDPAFPIEAALNGAAGVRRVRSATAIGLAVVWVEFEWGQDIQRARQIVTEKLALAEGSLPPEVEKPFLAPVSSIMGEIMFIALESNQHSPLDLRTTADTVIRRRLLATRNRCRQAIPRYHLPGLCMPLRHGLWWALRFHCGSLEPAFETCHSRIGPVQV